MDEQGSELGPGRLVPLAELHLTDEVGALLASRASVEWESRVRRRAYVERGALMMVRGRWLANPTKYLRVLLDVARERALASCAKSEATH